MKWNNFLSVDFLQEFYHIELYNEANVILHYYMLYIVLYNETLSYITSHYRVYIILPYCLTLHMTYRISLDRISSFLRNIYRLLHR